MRFRLFAFAAMLLVAAAQPSLASGLKTAIKAENETAGPRITMPFREFPPAQAPRTLVPRLAASIGGVTPAFITRPYIGFHPATSIFDHCNPDYSTDGRICEFDGSVALRSYGVDPSFTRGYATSPGGSTYLYYDGHNGWDLPLNYENVMAAADGVVRIAGIDPVNPCFGQNVVIDHANGFSTRYAHLSAIYVSQGQSVNRGRVIAQSGNTGCSSGPHLHFGVYITSSWTAIDPFGWTGAPGADPWPSDAGDLWLTGWPHDPLPDAPTNVTAMAAEGSAVVSWSAPSFDGGSGLTSYTVTSSPGGLIATVPGTAATATVSGLTNGTSYTFTVKAVDAVGAGPASSASNAVITGPVPTFFFAEGFTGSGFTESLALVMPNQSGTAAIDFYTEAGQLPPLTVPLTAGKAKIVDVNAAVGANHSVAARVTFSGQGVAERIQHFNTGTWHGSTEQVGATKAATEWDFAEGSTFGAYSEYLTLENFNPTAVPVSLNYATDTGAHPTKGLALPALSRTTVLVFAGDLTDNPSCTAGGGGNCGVGPGIGGVSVQVKSSGLPIVAERPFYVNGFNFGAGPVRDGHDALGANAPATQWFFAEGTTIAGFNEYLALQNAGSAAAAVTLAYASAAGPITKTLTVNPQTRATVRVFDSQYGVGRGVNGVSVRITSNQPIVAERAMYMVHDFGSGPVAGATDVLGASSLAKAFEFSYASTVSGQYDFVTVLNPNGSPANVTATYYTGSGPVTRNFTVSADTRATALAFNAGSGAGPGFAGMWILVTADQPILVEKPSYSSNLATYGATDTIGYAP